MTMLAAATDATVELLAVMGEQGTVVRGGGAPLALNLLVDDAVQDVGQYGRVMGHKRVVVALNNDWQFQRGDVVAVRGRTAKVDEVLADDGICNTVVLHG